MTHQLATLKTALAQAEQTIAELRTQNRQLLSIADNSALILAEQRIKELEAAAFEVCRAAEDLSTAERSRAIKELAKLIGYPDWYQL